VHENLNVSFDERGDMSFPMDPSFLGSYFTNCSDGYVCRPTGSKFLYGIHKLNEAHNLNPIKHNIWYMLRFR